MKIYIVGPMRGYPGWNLAAFDAAERCWREAGHQPFSPAQLFRALGYPTNTGEERDHCEHAIQVDLACVYAAEALALLPGWENSRGGTVEVAMGQYLGLPLYDALTMQRVYPVGTPWAYCPPADGKELASDPWKACVARAVMRAENEATPVNQQVERGTGN